MTPAPTLADALDPLLQAPERSGILLDVDGTLAPIVPDAESAAVPMPVQGLLVELAGRFGLVGCITGRRASDARRLVGLGVIDYVGMHGTELLRARSTQPEMDSTVEQWAPRVQELGRELDTPALRRQGVRREDKGVVVAFHWRGAPDEKAAEEAIAQAAARAEEAGLNVHRGRKVLELRPPVPMDKGAGVRTLLEARDIDNILFAGDDATDLDAFRALVELREEGRLSHVVRVGVLSDEGPAEIAGEADVRVDGTDGVTELLRALLGGP